MLWESLTMTASPPKTFREIPPGLVQVRYCALCLLALVVLPWSMVLAAPLPLDVGFLIKSSALLLEEKQYQKALATLAPALQQYPNDPQVLNLQGAILTKLKDYASAQKCYEEALKASPGFFPAEYNIGSLLALRQQWDPAITYYRNLLIEQPNNELVEYKLLLLLLHQGADPDLQQKLFSLDVPSNTPAWYYASAARAYKKGDKGMAAKYLDVAKSVFGDKTEIFQQELDESGLKDAKTH